MSYLQKLKDPRWQKLRLKVMERDAWCCCICGNDKLTLHVHHEQYSGEPWDMPIHKLKTLCENCHKNEHINNPELIEIKELHEGLLLKLSMPEITDKQRQVWTQAKNIAEQTALSLYGVKL